MDVWRQMAAWRAPEIIAFVGINTVALDCITIARRKFDARIKVLDLLRRGCPPGQINLHYIDFTPVGVCTTAYIQAALRALGLDAARHALASNVLDLYARARPNLKDTPEWRTWKGDHDRVSAHIGEATRALRTALAFVRTSSGAITAADSSFPRDSGGWTAWMLAAERNTNLAVRATEMAEDQLRQMGQAAMAEYGKARILTGTADPVATG
ncbi:unnamed protein product [Urochloa humidicola]